MNSVAVKEILTYGERLGITEIVSPPDIRGAVRHLLRYSGRESGHGTVLFPNSLLILPPVAADGAFENVWSRSALRRARGERNPVRGELVEPFPCRGGFETRPYSCLALPAQKITVFLRQFSERTGMPIFSSRYDDSLLHSRLTGLLRERGERQITVHGVLVQVCGLGVLLVGESGLGKTACGLALMGKGNRWVADDAVILEGRGDAVYGRGHQRTAGRIAVRERGILRAADLLGPGRIIQETRVDVLIRLVRTSERNALQEGESFQETVGVSLPRRDLVASDASPRRVAEQVKKVLSSKF